MLATCRSIVKSVVDMGVEDQDRWLTWEGDAADATRKGAFETARAIYAHALSVFPGDEEIWRAAASMEKQHGTREGLDALLKKAVTYCPQVGQAACTLQCWEQFWPPVSIVHPVHQNGGEVGLDAPGCLERGARGLQPVGAGDW